MCQKIMNDSFKVFGIYRHRIGTDGKGIRTLVALSNCPLNCEYCINKEIISHNKYKEYSNEKLLEVIIQDYCYFISTGGGITFGGAEPLLQAKQILSFAKLLPDGVDIDIETSLNVDFSLLDINFINILDSTTKLFIDIKNIDKNIYKSYTSKDNDIVIDNLKFISNCHYQDKCIIRIPNIPGYTNEDDINKSIKFVSDLGFKELDVFEYSV